MDKFIERAIWSDFTNSVKNKEITVLLGPRQVGKTTLMLELMKFIKKDLHVEEKYVFYYNLDDIDTRSKIKKQFRFIQKDIENKLGKILSQIDKTVYLFIDEGQKSPSIFELAKIFYEEKLLIKIYISGSSSLTIREKAGETLSGRVHYFYLYPFTFGEITGNKSDLYSLIEKIKDEEQLKEIAASGFRRLEELEFSLNQVLLYGSLPKVWTAPNLAKINYLNNFLTTYLDKDIKDIGLKINLENFHLSFKLLSDYVTRLINFSKISADLGIKRDSLYRYFEILEKTLIIKTINPFYFPLLKNVFKNRKLFFFDNGVINRLKGYLEYDELKRENSLGKLFENFVFQNLFSKSLNDIKKPNFYFFRDYQNHEIDLIYQRGEIIIPIEATFSKIISKEKIRNFEKFFSLEKKARFGIVFYDGEVKKIPVSGQNIYAVPYFLA